MKRPIRTLLIALVVLGIVFAVIEGVMYFRVKQALDDMALQMRLRAVLGYEGIHTSLTGSIVINGVSIRPRGLPDLIHADQVRLEGLDPLHILIGKMGRSNPPEGLRFTLRGVRFPLEGDNIRQLQRLMAEAATEQGITQADGCSTGNMSDPALLKSMGVRELVADIGFGYRWSKESKILAADLVTELRGMQSMEAGLSLTNVTLPGDQQIPGTMPLLAGLNLELRVEPEFGQRYIETCAERRNVTVDVFRQDLLGNVTDMLGTLGISLSAGLTEGLADFYKDWGDVHFAAQPKNPIGLMGLIMMSPDQRLDALGLELKVNDRRISDIRVDWRKPAPRRSDAPKTEEYREEYRNVPLAELGNYLHYKVRIHTEDRVRQGVLESIVATNLALARHVQGARSLFTFRKTRSSAQRWRFWSKWIRPRNSLVAATGWMSKGTIMGSFKVPGGVNPCAIGGS
jgi:hypothetical protein